MTGMIWEEILSWLCLITSIGGLFLQLQEFYKESAGIWALTACVLLIRIQIYKHELRKLKEMV